MDVWEKIAASRKTLGMSQQDLASKMGVKRSQIARWERKKPTGISLKNVAALEKALNMAPGDLYKECYKYDTEMSIDRGDANVTAG